MIAGLCREMDVVFLESAGSTSQSVSAITVTTRSKATPSYDEPHANTDPTITLTPICHKSDNDVEQKEMISVAEDTLRSFLSTTGMEVEQRSIVSLIGDNILEVNKAVSADDAEYYNCDF